MNLSLGPMPFVKNCLDRAHDYFDHLQFSSVRKKVCRNLDKVLLQNVYTEAGAALLPKVMVDKGPLPLTQLKGVVYANQAHARMLLDGEERRLHRRRHPRGTRTADRRHPAQQLAPAGVSGNQTSCC
jgi:hypothetical protein